MVERWDFWLTFDLGALGQLSNLIRFGVLLDMMLWLILFMVKRWDFGLNFGFGVLGRLFD